MQHDDLHIEKLYYSIGEVAEMFKVNTSLLRYWEKEFTLLHPKKNLKGERHYTKKDIESFRVIYHLVKEKGFTLDGAKDFLKNNKKNPLNTIEIIEKLELIKKQLIIIKNEI